MRQLARVVKIDGIELIPDAEFIELAIVGGWKVVVKKEEYQIGDLAIYVEIDAFLPEGNPLWQFLVDKSSREFEGMKGHVLRSIKLRGKVSQGLLLPLVEDHLLGTDLTEALGIIKYEPPIPAQLAGKVKGRFPSVIPKTDQERIQNLADEWDEIKSKQYEVTEKVEGSSMTAYLLKGEFGVCSRNLNLLEDENNTLWKVAIAQNIEDKLRAIFGDNAAFQGELIGEGVQGNYYKIKGHKFLVYDIYDIVKGEYLSPESRSSLCEAHSIDHVPILWEVFSLNNSGDSLDSLIEISNGFSKINQQKKREGIVFKSTSSSNLSGQRTSFKVISNTYLLSQK
jgi:RNA ligase (TIGR02306 family)